MWSKDQKAMVFHTKKLKDVECMFIISHRING